MKNFFAIFSFFIALSLKVEVWTDCSREFIEKNVQLKAEKPAARDLRFESKFDKVKLETGKDEDFYRHYNKSNGLITTSVDDEGHDRNVSKPVEILAETLHEDGKDPAQTTNQARFVVNDTYPLYRDYYTPSNKD